MNLMKIIIISYILTNRKLDLKIMFEGIKKLINNIDNIINSKINKISLGKKNNLINFPSKLIMKIAIFNDNKN